MPKHQTTKEANQLLLEGSLALAQIENSGVRVDAKYLDQAIKQVDSDIADMEKELDDDREVMPVWKERYGHKMSLGSPAQLETILFDDMGYQSKGMTKNNKRRRTDKEALELVDLDFVKTYIRWREYGKARSTYLIGLKREIVERDGNWYVHPSYNLNTTISFRSSANMLNFQNQPARNPEIAEMIRKCYIPRKGRLFGEPDYAQIEVRVPAAITGDKELRRYVLDPDSDMHRDQACNVFKIPASEVDRKTARATTKNNFVFASFYGAAPANCARRIWEDIDRFQIKTMSGIPMKDHLRKKGITELGDTDIQASPEPGTFAHHIGLCQDKLWKRFSGYDQWREDGYQKYLREGSIACVTGFAWHDIAPKNEVMNRLIQGPAFHCTLWSLIRILPRLRKYKLKTLVIGEIHDSLQLDIVPSEVQDVLDIVVSIMTKELPKAWKWLNSIPLEVECDISPVNKSWFHKKPWYKEAGLWQPKEKKVA